MNMAHIIQENPFQLHNTKDKTHYATAFPTLFGPVQFNFLWSAD